VENGILSNPPEQFAPSQPKNGHGIFSIAFHRLTFLFAFYFVTGHLLLTNLLQDKMIASSPSRIINLTSIAHYDKRAELNFDDLMNEKNYQPAIAYAQSKLANVLFTKELARRLKGNYGQILIYVKEITVELWPGGHLSGKDRNVSMHLIRDLIKPGLRHQDLEGIHLP
jgi:hypothetical protein